MANVSLHMDDTLKKQTEEILDQLGLSMTAAIYGIQGENAQLEEAAMAHLLRLLNEGICSGEEEGWITQAELEAHMQVLRNQET